MKAKRLKGLAGALLALLMLISLVPMSAMAATYDSDGNITSTAFELRNFAYGELVMAGTAVNPDNTAAVEATKFYESAEAQPENPNDLDETTDDFFVAGKQYYCGVKFSKDATVGDDVNFVEALTASLTAGGVDCESVFSLTNAQTGSREIIYKLPLLQAIPFGIDVTTVIAQGGDTAPQKGNFELEVLNADEDSNRPIADFTIGGKVIATDGKGSFNSKLTITDNDYGKVFSLLLIDGIFVKQKKGTAAGWSYDESVWYVTFHHDLDVNALNDEQQTMPDVRFACTKGKIVNGEFVADSETAADKITFTNTYTAHTHDYSQKHDKTNHWDECACGDVKDKEAHKFGDWTVTKEATESAEGEKKHTCIVCGYTEAAAILAVPKTGDDGRAVLWALLLAVSCMGIAGATVYTKKKEQ